MNLPLLLIDGATTARPHPDIDLEDTRVRVRDYHGVVRAGLGAVVYAEPGVVVDAGAGSEVHLAPGAHLEEPAPLGSLEAIDRCITTWTE